jgi:hypothetical protein
MTSVAYGIAFPASRGVLGPGPALLLDRLSAAPSAAFAPWKLRSAYAGNSMTARRSSDSATQDIGFAGGNLDSAALTTFCGAGDGFISGYYDQSGNGKNLAQATAANQPQIVSSGALIATVNGLPSPQFDGSSDMMAGANLTNFITAAAYTVVTLVRIASAFGSDATQYDQPSAVGSASGYLWHSYGATRVSLGHFAGGVKSVDIAASFPLTAILASRFDGSEIWGWTNGGAKATVAAGNVGNVGVALRVGQSESTQWLAGNIVAALFAKSALSLADINLIGADWAPRAGITWTTAT